MGVLVERYYSPGTPRQSEDSFGVRIPIGRHRSFRHRLIRPATAVSMPYVEKYYIALDSLTHPRVLLLLVGGGHYQLAGYRVGEGDGRSNWAGRKRTKAVDRI